METCFSHVIVVSLYYGTAITMDLVPKTYCTNLQDEVASVFYTIVTTMLNGETSILFEIKMWQHTSGKFLIGNLLKGHLFRMKYETMDLIKNETIIQKIDT